MGVFALEGSVGWSFVVWAVVGGELKMENARLRHRRIRINFVRRSLGEGGEN